MAKASEQFQQSDVALWGVIALVCGAVAVLSANLSAAVPYSVLSSLHKTRIEGASVEQLRNQVAEMRQETLRLQQDNTTMLTRFALQEQSGQEVGQRVGALEVSLPNILESLPAGVAIDRSAETASIANTGTPGNFEVEGGTVTVQQRPLQAPDAIVDQPMPPVVETVSSAVPDENAFGVALGPSVTAAQASGSWVDLSSKLGPLLLGMSPLLADEASGNYKRILVGPITDMSQASALCARLERVSISCIPMPFLGTPLTL